MRTFTGLSLWAVAALAFGRGAMTTPSSFAVSETGAATYTIPITLPPGRAGIEPKLTLNYNSQAGNGLLGMGWSLEGLSAVTRCPPTLAQDGIRGFINYDWNDRYCLDGQRLIAVNGINGSSGTEYRTERDGFLKIVSYGNAGNGPKIFKAWTKTGVIMEYGGSNNSGIEAQGKSSIAVWAVNKVSDVNGNYYVVSYNQDNLNGSWSPSRIDYTGNAVTGLPLVNSVQFVYEMRPDAVPSYEAGSLTKHTQRLKEIKTISGDSNTKNYHLQYSNSPGHSKLDLIKECPKPNDCLEPIAINWSPGFNGIFSRTLNQTGAVNGPFWRSGSDVFSTFTIDANGDGKTDVLQIAINDYMAQLLFSNGDGTFTRAFNQTSSANGPFLRTGLYTTYPLDVNGDGRTDILQIRTDDYQAQVLLSNGDGSFTRVLNQTAYALPGGPFWRSGSDVFSTFTIDANGDGKTDVLQIAINDYMAQLLHAAGDIENHVTSIETTENPAIQLFYKPLTDNSIYSKGNNSNYPRIDLQMPTNVISSTRTPNGIGGSMITNYHYANAIAELGTGRGFLGFEWVQSEDVGTGVVSRTWYRQDWPFTGLVSKVERGTSAATRSNLGVTTYTYDCTDFDSTPGCQSAPGKRYFPFVTRVEEKSWDLNGAALPITRTDTVYDCGNASTACFGNALDLTVSTLNPDGSPSGYSKRTQSQFYNDTNNWILGRLLRSSVIHTSP